MPKSRLFHERLPNGLDLLCEVMPSVRSAAYNLLVPAGTIHDPPNLAGAAAFMAEWVTRGAGSRSGQELLAAFDQLGVTHSESAQTAHLSFAGATLARAVPDALRLVADMVLRPHRDDAPIEAIRAYLIQNLRALEDDPGSKAAVELRARHYPQPWGRPTLGNEEALQAASPAALREHFQAVVQPEGAVLSVAGAVEWPALRDQVIEQFSDWEPRSAPPIVEQPAAERHVHLSKETQQIQIAAAMPSVVVSDPAYYQARAAANILGGYASSRLFTEVREKRGLCYSIHAGYECMRTHAALVCHAGTSTDRAQETLDVLHAELARLTRDGVHADELDTMRAGLKSALIMQQESSGSRAMALASDWYHLQRVRPISEIAAALDALTAASVTDYVRGLAIDDMTLVTLGPTPLALGNGSP